MTKEHSYPLFKLYYVISRKTTKMKKENILINSGLRGGITTRKIEVLLVLS